VVAPRPAAEAIKAMGPDHIAIPLDGEYLEPSHVREVAKLAERYDVVLVGSGLGTRPETAEAVKMLVEAIDKPMVVDADGIKALAGARIGRRNVVLTPHAGEFRALSGVDPPRDPPSRGEAVRRVAADIGATVLLKGRIDTVSDGERVKHNLTGVPEMSVAGTGDVLAGVVAAFLARSSDALRAAAAAAFVVGLAGEILRGEKRFFRASELVGRIPDAIARAEEFIG